MATRKTHTVVKGDTLASIAKKYNITGDQIVAWNKATYPSLATNRYVLSIGWKLIVESDVKHSHTKFTPSLKGTISIAATYSTLCPGSNGTKKIPKGTKIAITAKCVEADKYEVVGYGWVSRKAVSLDSQTVSKKDATKQTKTTATGTDTASVVESLKKGTVNPVTSVAYDITDLLVEEAGGIQGIPYQFMDDVDSRLDDKVAFGHTYIDRIVSKMPLLLLSPGLPNFLPSYKESEKKTVVSALLGMAGGNSAIADNIQQLLSSENGRYYTFDFKYNDYFFNVNKLCRYGAVALGIQDVVHKCNGATRNTNTLGRMCWQDQVNNSFKGFINSQEYVAFYVDSETSITESFGNSTTSSQLAGSFNSLSEISRELQFLAGPIAGIKANAINPEEFKDSLSDLTQMANQVLGNDKLFTHLEEGFKTIGKGGKLLFPEIWEDSDFSKSYDINLKLRTPDGDKISWYLNIFVPLMHLYAMAAPRELGPNGYKSPYLVRGFYKGIFNCDLGIITNMSISKGKEGAWTVDGLPTEVDVSFTIKDLYGLLMTSGEKYTLAEMPYKFFRNTALIDYISCSCGININKPELTRLVETYVLFTKNTLSDAYNSVWMKLNNGATNFVSNLYRKVVYFGNA